MELYLEIIINFFVILFICCFASLVFCAKDKLSSDGIYIVSDKVKEKHYHLKFSKVFFLVVFAINRKWNKGLISKYTFWALSILYYYFIAEFICHIIFCIVATPFKYNEVTLKVFTDEALNLAISIC